MTVRKICGTLAFVVLFHSSQATGTTDVPVPFTLEQCKKDQFWNQTKRKVVGVVPDKVNLLAPEPTGTILAQGVSYAMTNCPPVDDFAAITIELIQRSQVRVRAETKSKERLEWYRYEVRDLRPTEIDKMFFEAVKLNDPDLAFALLKKGADVNMHMGRVAWEIPENISKDRERGIRLLRGLLEEGLYVDNPDAAYNLLGQFVGKGDLELTKLVTEHMNLIRDEISSMPMHVAVNGRHYDIITHFLASSANINVLSKHYSTSKDTPLVLAVSLCDAQMVNFLLSKGADLNAKGTGLTPLSVAATCSNCKSQEEAIKVIRLLLDAGADISEIKGYNEWTRNRFPKVIEFLVETRSKQLLSK